MLLVVGWSAVVVWLNVRPRVDPFAWIEYGCPLTCARTLDHHFSGEIPRVRLDYIDDYRLLTANIAIGLLAVAVLTFASKYLVRAIVAGLRAIMSKPPNNGKGPETARQGL